MLTKSTNRKNVVVRHNVKGERVMYKDCTTLGFWMLVSVEMRGGKTNTTPTAKNG